MEVSKAIKKRSSIRAYKGAPVGKPKLKKVLEAGRLAPSAHNDQDWEFVVVFKKEQREALAKAAHQEFIQEAPIVIAAVALNPDKKMSCEVPQYAVDLAIAVDHMTLQAADLGLGTCWIGAFKQKKVKNILSVPEDKKVVTLLPLGYPKEESEGEKERKSLDEIVSFDKY